MIQKTLSITVDAIKSDHKYCSEKCPKTGDHIYSFRVPYGSAYEEVYEVLNDMISDLKKYEQDSKEYAQKAQADAAPCAPESE